MEDWEEDYFTEEARIVLLRVLCATVPWVVILGVVWLLL